MPDSHRARVQALLTEAREAHRAMLRQLPDEIRPSLPVDAQGITHAMDHIAQAAGFSTQARRELVRAHAVNPAVLHARVFGATPLRQETVVAAFVEGARVRAEGLVALARAVDARLAGDGRLVAAVSALLLDSPLPATGEQLTTRDPIADLRESYAAQERAALLIAAGLDVDGAS